MARTKKTATTKGLTPNELIGSFLRTMKMIIITMKTIMIIKSPAVALS